jgi:5-methyltetrahydrofolate--homocysteine methyltransferase
LNSASLERLDVLDLAAGEGCPVVLSASVEGRMPVSAKERVASGQRIIEVATGRGLTLSALYVDALVLPVAVDADVGLQFLDAVRSLRSTYGRDVHLTGGLSNVSFGLPNRRLINDVFIDLAVGAGADSGIMDPVVNDPRRVFHLDRDTRAYELAADLITGRDPYALGFLAAYRAGELL